MVAAETIASIVFMKAGFHGRETLDEIIARKVAEEKQAGYIFWGYGGSLCHPSSQVLPFAAAASTRGLPVRVVMPVTVSRCELEPSESCEFSTDRNVWQSLPSGVSVRSCRYALVVKNLRVVSEYLELNRYAVAVGANKGMPLDQYIRGRVDKACAELRPTSQPDSSTRVRLGLTADLVPPFAVFLR